MIIASVQTTTDGASQPRVDSVRTIPAGLSFSATFKRLAEQQEPTQTAPDPELEHVDDNAVDHPAEDTETSDDRALNPVVTDSDQGTAGDHEPRIPTFERVTIAVSQPSSAPADSVQKSPFPDVPITKSPFAALPAAADAATPNERPVLASLREAELMARRPDTGHDVSRNRPGTALNAPRAQPEPVLMAAGQMPAATEPFSTSSIDPTRKREPIASMAPAAGQTARQLTETDIAKMPNAVGRNAPIPAAKEHFGDVAMTRSPIEQPVSDRSTQAATRLPDTEPTLNHGARENRPAMQPRETGPGDSRTAPPIQTPGTDRSSARKADNTQNDVPKAHDALARRSGAAMPREFSERTRFPSRENGISRPVDVAGAELGRNPQSVAQVRPLDRRISAAGPTAGVGLPAQTRPSDRPAGTPEAVADQKVAGESRSPQSSSTHRPVTTQAMPIAAQPAIQTNTTPHRRNLVATSDGSRTLTGSESPDVRTTANLVPSHAELTIQQPGAKPTQRFFTDDGPTSISEKAQPTVTTLDLSMEIERLVDAESPLRARFDLGAHPVHMPTMGEQMLNRVDHVRFAPSHVAETLLRQAERPVEISLNPEELGRVRMTLSVTDSGLTLAIAADRPETLDLMRRHIDQLAQEFRKMGYSDIAFDFGQNGSGSERETQSHGSASVESMAETAPSPVAEPINRTTGSGLDLRL